MQIVQDPLFVRGPQRCDQIPFCAVAGDPVHSRFRRQLPQTGEQPVGVFLHGQAAEFSCLEICRQIGAPKYVEQVEFDAVGPGGHSLSGGFGGHFGCFARKTQNDVGHHLNSAGFQPADCVKIDFVFVPPADVSD